MKALLIPLTLEGPVLLTGVGNGEENSSQTLPYIPGNTLRGALIGRYHSDKDDLLEDETAVRLFFSDQVIYLNAYPVIGKQRSLPTPASWRKKKGEYFDENITELAACDFALTFDDTFDEAIKQPFCSFDIAQSTLPVFKPQEELATHIGGQARGIVTKENDVFQYQALARGQTFTAVILTQNEIDRGDLKKLLEQNPILYLGRSRSARYGRVQVGNIEAPKDDWHEAAINKPEGKTIITLLSDVLLRDANGQPTHNLDGWLAERLGKDQETFKSNQRFIKPTLVGGFNRKWGLPLPQLPALEMGSVFVYDSALLSPDELTGLLESGIGDRRVEGFGRIAVNWQEQREIRLEKPTPPKLSKPKKLSDASQKLAQEMADRILRKRLDAHISEEAHKYKITGNINNHQLGRLRSVLREVINAGGQDTKRVTAFLKNMKSTAAEQYRRARVKKNEREDAGRLLTWLEERLRQKDALNSFSIKRHPEVAGQTAGPTDALKSEYTLRLIEAVINGQMKQNRRDNR